MGKAFIVCGSPGSGKSTYGQALAEKRRAFLLDIDFSTERLVRLSLAESGHNPDDRDSTYFKNTYRQPIYDTLFDITRQNLPWNDVVIIGPFTREIRNADWPSELSKRLCGPVEIHYVYCQPDIRKDRLIRRGNPRDIMKLKDWDNHVTYYGDEKPPEFSHVFIDTSDK
mgnify:CR=1 FL=1